MAGPTYSVQSAWSGPSAPGLVLPYVNAEAMNLHLQEISRHVTPGAHAVLVLDGAGWHGAAALTIPDNISLLPLPSYSPELNPVEQWIKEGIDRHLPQEPAIQSMRILASPTTGNFV